jgi:hypothetical protein
MSLRGDSRIYDHRHGQLGRQPGHRPGGHGAGHRARIGLQWAHGLGNPTSVAGTAALIKRKDRQRRAGDQLIALSSYVITWTVTVLAGEAARTVLSGQLADVYLANATRTSHPSSSTHYYLVMNLSRRGILKAGLAAGAVASTSARGPGDRVFQPRSSPYLRPAAGGLPSRVFGTYWPSWDGPALRSLPSAYNTVWLFAAVPVGGPPGTTGAVYWSQSRENTTQFNTDLAAPLSVKLV